MIAPAFWAAPSPTLLARALQPLGALIGAATAARMAGQGAKVGAPVICVGNFVVGGAGKTPTALALGRMALARGRRVAFLSRGYGGARRVAPIAVDRNIHDARAVGDEPLLLARLAPCFVGADRVEAARLAVEAGADLLILDDGLQNPSLMKDLSFAVVDGESGFGNGLCLPAGPLRAPLPAQRRRVDALIVVGGDELGAARIAAALPDAPILRANLEPEAAVAAMLIGRDVVAFAGIARPEKFHATLRRIGARIVATHAFPDHRAFPMDAVDKIVAAAARRQAIAVTTEKDFIRMAPAERAGVTALPVTLRFERPDEVARLLACVTDRT